ncbi:MAG: class II fructose-bisphosphate aldolase, partial [Rhodospirillales bacterium]|nr:class II fructose-bisphosphate aldolase [Rhodospirillales bacterium]
MALVSMRQLLDHAAENNYGVPAFNINNMEQMLAIMAAADKTDSPVILQASRGARAYANDVVLRHLIEAAVEMYPDIPICMHLDHGNNQGTCLSAMANGFSSVMMDGSLEEDAKTPSSYEYNVDITSAVVDTAHMIGVSVEGELGCLGSLETGEGEKEDGHGFEGKLDNDMLVTDSDDAADFVAKTKVDALAVAIG